MVQEIAKEAAKATLENLRKNKLKKTYKYN